ncbi:MAG TPA: histidine--tRNA ligase [Gaiellaceae bacterium]|nr:histidine--tRNA ligase [Gaiellaceae bacterium]
MHKGPLPGFRDFYPDELAQRAHVMAAWRRVARRYAFQEYDGPPLEPLDLYTKKSGEEIVGQLYNFTDKGGREVSLRPEMTPTVARMVAARANALRKPVRWFSVPQLFRYERQQKGRLREHYQLNVDIFGEPDVSADAELLAVAIDMMRELGLTGDDVVARVSDRRLLTDYLLAVGVPESGVSAAYGVIDKVERTPKDVSREKLVAAGASDAAADRVLALPGASLAEFMSTLREAGRYGDAAAQFERYFAFLTALVPDAERWVRFDPSIVRGLAYYTGIVFELFDRRGEFRAICGGGRYDNLLEALGGVAMPALGFGMGDVVLGELLRARGLMPAGTATVDYWVAGADTVAMPRVMGVAARLRARDRSVEYALREQALGRQLKAAASAGARRVVILRDASGEEATVKTLADGNEQVVRLDDWLQTA